MTVLVIIIMVLAVLLIFWKPTKNTPTTSNNTIPPGQASSQTEISGKIINLYQNPQKIEITTRSGNDYTLVITSSTQIIRDVGGTVNGTFGFNSLHIEDTVGAQISFDSDGRMIPSLVEQMNSAGMN